jgi:hypothetical protein
MSTTDPTCKPLTPGIKIDNVKFEQLKNGTSLLQISFPFPRPTTPFPPLVQATFFGLNGPKTNILEVSAIAFIYAEAVIEDISVYWNSDNENPKFSIAYDAPEVAAKEFTAYQVSFSVQIPEKPAIIETIVWDIDPITSRGTETTVQP